MQGWGGLLTAGSRRAFRGCRSPACCCSCSCGCGHRWPRGPAGRSGSGTCGAQHGYASGTPPHLHSPSSPMAGGSCATPKLRSGPSSRPGRAGMPHGVLLGPAAHGGKAAVKIMRSYFCGCCTAAKGKGKPPCIQVGAVMSEAGAGAIWVLLRIMGRGNSLGRRQNPLVFMRNHGKKCKGVSPRRWGRSGGTGSALAWREAHGGEVWGAAPTRCR